MTEAEEAHYLAIIRQEQDPDPAAFQAGHVAHTAGKAFHESPYPFDSVRGLSWRIGWNGRALEQRDP